MVEFSIAIALLKVSMIGIDSVGSVFSPTIFDSIIRSRNELKSIFNRARNLFIIISLLSFILIFFFAETVIVYFFSDKYNDAFRLLLILQAGQLIHSFFGPNALTCKLAGFPVLISTYKLFTTFLMIFINFLLYEKFGVDVLAFSYVFSISIWNIMVYFKVKTLL